MDAIEKRARELLATEWESCGAAGKNIAKGLRTGASLPVDLPSIRAIIAALTPPEGYVLVPVEPTEEEVRATNHAQQVFFDENVESKFFSSEHYMEESVRFALNTVRESMLTARPEVP